MIAPTMHLCAARISIELLQEMITQGWEAGTTSIVRCIEGLPANAHFEYIEPSADNVIVLVFSHPTWPAVTSVDSVPYVGIRIERVELADKRGRS